MAFDAHGPHSILAGPSRNALPQWPPSRRAGGGGPTLPLESAVTRFETVRLLHHLKGKQLGSPTRPQAFLARVPELPRGSEMTALLGAPGSSPPNETIVAST